jgi:putative zinc finger/helix-turn-helix YgiT family protein
MAKVTTNGYCPNCEAERELKRVRTREKVTVRGEPIEIEALYWRCLTCGEEFEAPGDNHDELAEAYRLYRTKKGFMQPEDIKALRDQYGLTQGELAQILGFGAVTLSRYETGALQSAAHDRMLQMIRDPRALWAFMNRLGDRVSVPAATREKLRNKLQALVGSSELLDPALQTALDYKPDDRSGQRRFTLEKFVNAILFFCERPQWKTAINKFLFYADFKHFRRHSRSITGARYAHAPFGPCPDKFEHLFVWLADRGSIEITEVPAKKDYVGERIRALTKPDISIFSSTEVRVLEDVKRRLGSMTAKQLSDLSHGELGYTETQSGELIPYRYAKHLRI